MVATCARQTDELRLEDPLLIVRKMRGGASLLPDVTLLRSWTSGRK